MTTICPKIIQGGMGAGVSNWRLAQAVSANGQLGVVSGTALDNIMIRRLQDGDTDGSIRHALTHFPFPKIAQKIINNYFIKGGKAPDVPYKTSVSHSLEHSQSQQELYTAANFVEVFLARQGHSNPVGINYLEKIQLPHLASIYGAILAGVAVIIVGAGIPLEMPEIISRLSRHEPVKYQIKVHDAPTDYHAYTTFNPADFNDDGQTQTSMPKPAFLPIVSSSALAAILITKAKGQIDGFIVEGPTAGGHNAPPRGLLKTSASGEPIYGPRDKIDLEAIRKLNLPFWLAGGYGSAAKLRSALSEGAAGVQVGTAFALCSESALAPALRHALRQKTFNNNARVFTDIAASPTGFPFKVAQLEETLSDQLIYEQRVRICDLGYLREAFLQQNGTIGFRCPAEPLNSFLAKGGKIEDTRGRKCLCNALLANIDLPQVRKDGSIEKALVTLGDCLNECRQFCENGSMEYSAADVIRIILAT